MVSNKKTKIIVANWKMFGNYDFTVKYFKTLCNAILPQNYLFIVCPPFPYIGTGVRIIAEHQNGQIAVGAQDVSKLTKISSTGDISVEILEDCLVQAVIVGHSERRAIGDTNEIINKKINNLQTTGIIPIFCIGENENEKNDGKTKEILKKQISEGLKNIKQLKHLVVSYEPVWAIGNGITPAQSEIADICSYIKEEVNKTCSTEDLNILYGGSVNENNIDEMLSNNAIDGVILGTFGREVEKLCNFFEKKEQSSWQKSTKTIN